MLKKILLATIFFIQINILAAQNIKEIFIVSENWDKYTNKDGSGLYFDIARVIYEPLDIKVKIGIYPYSRTSQMVKRKLADAWLGSYIDEEDYAIYPKYYFDKDIITAMFKKNKFLKFKGQNSLKDKNIGWIRGYDFNKYIDVDIKKHERNNRKAILLSLSKDRFDIFLDDKYDMEDAIKKLNFDTSEYNFVELFNFKLYPAFRKDETGKKLKEIWDNRFKKLINDGSLKKLYIKHNKEKFYFY